MKPTFFAKPADFRAWLERHHGKSAELLVGFYKRSTGRPSITWPESVDQSLCFGWIDGVRKSLGDDAYTIRFTPRKPGSNWSAVNVARVKELIRKGHLRPAGLAAFEKLKDEKAVQYSYEQRKTAQLDAAQERRFRASKAAWAFFQGQPPWYRRVAAWWVISAKKEETRLRRLDALIGESDKGRRVGPLRRPAKGK